MLACRASLQRHLSKVWKCLFMHLAKFHGAFIIFQYWYIEILFRCTFSYPNWMFVFMASVNHISRCHGSFLNCVTCHDLFWGHWWETMPWMPFIWSNLLFNVFSTQWLPIWCPIAGTTSHLAKLPGDHLHLYSHFVLLQASRRAVSVSQVNSPTPRLPLPVSCVLPACSLLPQEV